MPPGREEYQSPGENQLVECPPSANTALLRLSWYCTSSSSIDQTPSVTATIHWTSILCKAAGHVPRMAMPNAHNGLRNGPWHNFFFLSGSAVKNPVHCRRFSSRGFNSWVGKDPLEKKMQSTPVFLLGKSHGPDGLHSHWYRTGYD